MRDVRAELQRKPMNGFQIYVIAVMTFMNAMDGYDVLAMSFAGTVLTRSWGVTADTMGWLISAGLIGMMAGSLFIAPFADKIGRRALILVALFLDTVGLFASAYANSVAELFFWRVITGLGIGAMLASVASLTAEYASARHRSLCISIMAIGYPAGAVLGGMAAAAMVAKTGNWEPIFLFGGFCSLVALPMVLVIPDSVEFLVEKRPKNLLHKLNKLLPKLGMEKLDQEPVASSTAHESNEIYKTLLANHGRSLVLITTTYFLFAASLYFPLTWMPGMLVQAGLSPELGISGSVLMNGGGVIGGTLFGLIAGRWGGLRNTVPAFMLLALASITLFGLVPINLTLMLVIGGIIGFGLIGTVSGLYATYPVIFPPTVRTTGTGIVIGVGRIGGIISPVVAGYLIEGGTPRAIYCFLLALPLLIAVFLLRSIKELKLDASQRS